MNIEINVYLIRVEVRLTMNGSDPSVCLIGLVNPRAKSPCRASTKNTTRCLNIVARDSVHVVAGNL